MAINSFSTLKTAVLDWLDRDDIGDAVDNMVSLMEARLYSRLRVRGMETALSETIASGTITLPSDFLEFKHAYLDTTPTVALEFKPADWVQKRYPTRTSSGRPQFAAVDAGTLIFGPYPDSGYAVAGTYYARPAALSVSNETNFLTTSWPDLLLYGTLVHSAMYLGQDSRLSAWEVAYDDAFKRITSADKREGFPAGVALRATAA